MAMSARKRKQNKMRGVDKTPFLQSEGHIVDNTTAKEKENQHTQDADVSRLLFFPMEGVPEGDAVDSNGKHTAEIATATRVAEAEPEWDPFHWPEVESLFKTCSFKKKKSKEVMVCVCACGQNSHNPSGYVEEIINKKQNLF